MPIITLPTSDAPSLLEIDECGATEDEYQAVRDRRLPVLLRAVPDGVDDLRAIEPVASHIESLGVYAARVTDFRSLARMPHLTSFDVGETASGARDLSVCPVLRSYSGSFDGSVRLSDAACYDFLALFGTDFRSLGRWHGSAAQLRFMAPRRVVLDLSGLSDVFRGVEELWVDGFREVRLPSRAVFPSLRRLRVRLGAVAGLADVARLDGLRVTLEDVRAVDDWDLIAPPPNGRIELDGRSPADASFSESHGQAEGWYFGERDDR